MSTEAIKKKLKETYSSFEIMRAFHIPKERLRDWIDRGFVKASKPSSGRGIPAAYTVNDIYGLALFMKLLDHGFSREKASQMTDICHNTLDDRFHDTAVAIIVFRRKTDDWGNVNIGAIFFGDGFKRIPIYDADGIDVAFIEQRPDIDWDSELTINYKKIRDAVDKALSGT